MKTCRRTSCHEIQSQRRCRTQTTDQECGDKVVVGKGQTGQQLRRQQPYLGVDGEGEVAGTAAVHGHVGFLHTPALQTDLKRGKAPVRRACPSQSALHLWSSRDLKVAFIQVSSCFPAPLLWAPTCSRPHQACGSLPRSSTRLGALLRDPTPSAEHPFRLSHTRHRFSTLIPLTHLTLLAISLHYNEGPSTWPS